MEMSRVEISLTRLETLLRAIIEGDVLISGIPRKLRQQVMGALVQAMHKEMEKIRRIYGQDNQSSIAPDLYTIVLPENQAELLINHPGALDRLAQKLESLASQANLKLTGSPILRVVPDPRIKELHIMVEYSHTGVSDSYTTEMAEVPASSERVTDLSMPDAFLIVNGLSTYPLTSPVINIGSDPSNQLVLHDPGVSPIHAQLRFSTGRFIIFDLDSKHGTFINGLAVSSQALNPGDLIRLAGVPLVYGQETIPQPGYTQEMSSNPPALEVL